MHVTMKITESSSSGGKRDIPKETSLDASDDGVTRPSTRDSPFRSVSLLYAPISGRRANSYTSGSQKRDSEISSPVDVLGFDALPRKRSQGDSLSERDSNPGTWKGSTKYIRAAAKMSTYLFGNASGTSVRSKSLRSGDSVSVRSSPTTSPLPNGFGHSLRILDWAPVTYTHDRAPLNVPERVVGFCVYRTCCLNRRSKRPNTDPSTTLRIDGGPVMLHPQHATCAFKIPDRAASDVLPLGEIDPEFFEDLMSSMTPISSDGRDLRRTGTLGRSSLGGSLASGASQESTPQRSGPTSLGTMLGLAADYSVVRHVRARGVVVAKPTAIERYGLDGRLQKRVNMVPEGDGQVWLINAIESATLGVGSVLICTTSSFKIIVYRCSDLRLVRDINLSICENAYRRYIRNHAVRPVEDERGLPTALLCPSSFARRNGLLFVGTSSGLVHVWRLPEGTCQCLLPPPLPLGNTVGVVDIVYHAFMAAIRDGVEDIGSPAWDLPETDRPEPPARMHRFSCLWVFYEDGRAALWDVDENRSSEFPPDDPSPHDEASDTMLIGNLSGPFSDHYAKVKKPLQVCPGYELKFVFDWTKAALLRPEFDCERTRTFLSSVTLVRAMASERSPVVCLLLRSGARAAFGEQAMMILSPLADVPVVAFVSLRKLGIPNCPKPGMFVSTLSRLHLRSASVTECEIIPRTCLIMAFSGMIRVIQLDVRETCTAPGSELRLSLFPLATQLIRRRTEFSSVKYDEDFDQLLLGLES